eukprot:355334-Chlamydomonas_euryale.AAC.2
MHLDHWSNLQCIRSGLGRGDPSPPSLHSCILTIGALDPHAVDICERLKQWHISQTDSECTRATMARTYCQAQRFLCASNPAPDPCKCGAAFKRELVFTHPGA